MRILVFDETGQDTRYAIDPTHIHDARSGQPSVTLDQGLAKTVQWHLDYADWWQALLTRDGVGQRLGAG